MQFSASYKKYTLQFKRPAGTSRGIYNSKESWFIFLSQNNKTGVGECSLLKGLSIDDSPDFEIKLNEICQSINAGIFNFDEPLHRFPSIQFGLETALLDLQHGGNHLIFPSDFTSGKRSITTNGLIWMGSSEFMNQQIAEKIEQGFSCIKLKVGAADWETEKAIIEALRSKFSAKQLTIRVDANGAYSPEQAENIMQQLVSLNVHSIEQPIAAGNWDKMHQLCTTSPLAIALDEELIGIYPTEKKIQLLETIKPKYLILKPGLLGGFSSSDEWIELAKRLNIRWWATSALESNIGLNAIAQWTATKNNPLPQGLGTGMLYTNNIDSPLYLNGENLLYNTQKKWGEINGDE